MKLYYHPGACSLADHIALHEADATFDLVKVDLKEKKTEAGEDYRTINPKGYVPALRLDDGAILTENIAILGWIADTSDALTPTSGLARYRLLETLAFISTELHKGFKPFFNPAASDAERDEAKENLGKRFALVETQLGDGPFIQGDALTVADCYLFVMLFWAKTKAKLDLPAALTAYYDRLKTRPAFVEALEMEGLKDAA